MKVFIVGIKGVGVCGLATLYKEWGHKVSGSDTDEEFFTDKILQKLGIAIVDFDAAHITQDIDLLIYSTAYSADHLQIARARELGVKTLSYSEALAEIFNGAQRGIVVTGTHGKTTSTAMLGRVLEDAGFDPTVAVGGELLEWGRTARATKLWKSHFHSLVVVEGDEYQAKFLELNPYAVLLTNIEYDHPDFFKDEEAYRDAFRKLIVKIPPSGLIIAHESLRDFISTIYRTNAPHASPRIEYFTAADFNGALNIFGEHNRTNAAGVLKMARALGIADEVALKALANFRGTRRRMEFYTDADADIVVIDDYAHHPTEIRATLAALRERYPERQIVAVFQPHTYSRTRALLQDFAAAFGDADHVILVETYSSAREKEKSISINELRHAMSKWHENVEVARTLDEAHDMTKQKLQTINSKLQTVVVALGAGDLWRIAEALTKAL
ncbi:MAG: UDP-N-acetylmuramate--L-alanine ligase [Candidatus Ryanbacteria bacterium]|nr:UDP-N-acetylmuramate--L-alanine ligase [Candidatus Ryanbacteria bacterium]